MTRPDIQKNMITFPLVQPIQPASTNRSSYNLVIALFTLFLCAAQSTTLQTGTQSVTLQTGAQSTLLQGGAQGSLIQGTVEREGGPMNILFVLDASYSMKEKLGGQDKKINAAKQVLENALSRIPADVNLGLRVFGQGFSNIPELDCRQTALLVPIGQGNRRSIIEKIRRIEPFGMTPLEYALRQAAEDDFRDVQGSKTLILITDGADTCGGDPCRYIARLPLSGIRLKVDVVGLDLKREPAARWQLQCIAAHSGGTYFDANTVGELIKAFDDLSKNTSKSITGKIITPNSQETKNTQTPPELTPIVPDK